MTGGCGRCGAELDVSSASAGTFTSISVSYHDDDRTDWSESYCPSCGDEILADAVPSIVQGIDR